MDSHCKIPAAARPEHNVFWLGRVPYIRSVAEPHKLVIAPGVETDGPRELVYLGTFDVVKIRVHPGKDN